MFIVVMPFFIVVITSVDGISID